MASGFAKLVVVDDSSRTQVDLGFDPATNAAVLTSVGPVRSLADLAGDKLLALFARAASRDFVDVSALLEHFSREDLQWPRIEGSRLMSWPMPSEFFRRMTAPMSSHRCPMMPMHGSWLGSLPGKQNFAPRLLALELTHPGRVANVQLVSGGR